jgi:hypothetical protein
MSRYCGGWCRSVIGTRGIFGADLDVGDAFSAAHARESPRDFALLLAVQRQR